MALFSRTPKAPADAPAAPPARPAGRAPARPAPARPAAKRPPLTTDPAVSPFFADHTRAGLTDRFAELNRRRGDWVLISVVLGACLMLSLGMNAYQAVRTHLIPFKVVVDGQSGYLLDAGVLEPMDQVEDIYIQRDLRETISGLRTVTSDIAATTTRFNQAFGRVIQGSPAQTFLADLYIRPGNDPNELFGRGQRTVVEFTGPAPLAGTDTWSFQWIERTAMAGGGVTEDLYRGSLTVKIIPITDVETAQANPLGVWIDGIQWEQVSSKYLDLEELGNGSPLDLLYPDPNRQPNAPGFRGPVGTPAARPAAAPSTAESAAAAAGGTPAPAGRAQPTAAPR